MSVRVHQTTWPVADLAARVAEYDAVVCVASLLCDEDALARHVASLSAGEGDRHAGYSNGVVARRFACGRGLVRAMLASVLGVPPGGVPVREGLHGKPQLAPGTPHAVRFNVSHTDDLLVVALSRSHDVGVDVERVRALEQWQRVADRVLDAQELRVLAAEVAQGADPGETFLRLWCRVEAELKAIGCGIQGLDAHRAGERPRGLRTADVPLVLPPGMAVTGVRYQAAVALCAPGAGDVWPRDSARHARPDSCQDTSPVASPARASTP